jgi:hypothetical protein
VSALVELALDVLRAGARALRAREQEGGGVLEQGE